MCSCCSYSGVVEVVAVVTVGGVVDVLAEVGLVTVVSVGV